VAYGSANASAGCARALGRSWRCPLLLRILSIELPRVYSTHIGESLRSWGFIKFTLRAPRKRLFFAIPREDFGRMFGFSLGTDIFFK